MKNESEFKQAGMPGNGKIRRFYKTRPLVRDCISVCICTAWLGVLAALAVMYPAALLRDWRWWLGAVLAGATLVGLTMEIVSEARLRRQAKRGEVIITGSENFYIIQHTGGKHPFEELDIKDVDLPQN